MRIHSPEVKCCKNKAKHSYLSGNKTSRIVLVSTIIQNFIQQRIVDSRAGAGDGDGARARAGAGDGDGARAGAGAGAGAGARAGAEAGAGPKLKRSTALQGTVSIQGKPKGF